MDDIKFGVMDRRGCQKKKSEQKKISDLVIVLQGKRKENKTCRIALRIYNGSMKLFCLCETSPSTG